MLMQLGKKSAKINGTEKNICIGINTKASEKKSARTNRTRKKYLCRNQCNNQGKKFANTNGIGNKDSRPK